MSALIPDDTQDPHITSLLGDLGELIRQARQNLQRAVDTAQVQTYWQIGRHIVEFEQNGSRRAVYGKQLLATLAKVLTVEFGKGFDETNLRKMRLFYQAFPIRDALRLELSWTHYRRLLLWTMNAPPGMKRCSSPSVRPHSCGEEIYPRSTAKQS